MLQRNINNSELRSLVSHRAKGLCFSVPTTNTYTDKTDNKSVSEIHASQVKEYYTKYSHEVVLTYTKQSMTLNERKKSLNKFVIKLFRKLYGNHNVKDMIFDYHAVLESKDKFKNQTHFHWHLLVHLPNDRKHWDLDQEFVDKNLVWNFGDVWVRDEPLFDPYGYITDYLNKHEDSVPYYGE